MKASPQLTRATRTWRGFAAALFATFCAAASHSLAGGIVTWLALLATIILALPICVALAGKLASTWRITLAVACSQVLYHWSFSGIGALPHSGAERASLASTMPAPIGAHTHHNASPTHFSPELTASHEGMWLAHIIAGIATILLLCYGERALLALRSALRRIVLPAQAQLSFPLSVDARPGFFTRATRELFTGINSITHRGPPRAAEPRFYYADSFA